MQVLVVTLLFCCLTQHTDPAWPWAQKKVGHECCWYHFKMANLALGFAGSKWQLWHYFKAIDCIFGVVDGKL